jgi:hypothetical protein
MIFCTKIFILVGHILTIQDFSYFLKLIYVYEFSLVETKRLVKLGSQRKIISSGNRKTRVFFCGTKKWSGKMETLKSTSRNLVWAPPFYVFLQSSLFVSSPAQTNPLCRTLPHRPAKPPPPKLCYLCFLICPLCNL